MKVTDQGAVGIRCPRGYSEETVGSFGGDGGIFIDFLQGGRRIQPFADASDDLIRQIA